MYLALVWLVAEKRQRCVYGHIKFFLKHHFHDVQNKGHYCLFIATALLILYMPAPLKKVIFVLTSFVCLHAETFSLFKEPGTALTWNACPGLMAGLFCADHDPTEGSFAEAAERGGQSSRGAA